MFVQRREQSDLFTDQHCRFYGGYRHRLEWAGAFLCLGARPRSSEVARHQNLLSCFGPQLPKPLARASRQANRCFMQLAFPLAHRRLVFGSVGKAERRSYSTQRAYSRMRRILRNPRRGPRSASSSPRRVRRTPSSRKSPVAHASERGTTKTYAQRLTSGWPARS